MALPVQLTVRGTYIPETIEGARVLHNDTAGSPQGVAAARALGDLSHKVYTQGKELLFLDVWCDAQSIGQFFGNSNVQEQAARLFSQRDAAVWMKATGSYSYALPAGRGKEAKHVGMIRGPIASPERAIEIFNKVDEKAVRDARRRGLLSHELFIKIPLPGDNAGLELLGIDVWTEREGMMEHYSDATHMTGLDGAFAGKPDATVWDQAPGAWSEW
jgi:hypothetical protein